MRKQASQSRRLGPFSGLQLTAIAITLMISLALVPSTVWAVDTFTNVAVQDSVSGVKASVDSGGHLLVAGPVSGSVSAAPRPPAAPWFTSIDVPNSGALTTVAGATILPINVTSLSVGFTAAGTANLVLQWVVVRTSASTCDDKTAIVDGGYYGTLYHVPGLVSSAGGFSASFPTPLQVRAPSGFKACLLAYQPGTTPPITVNVSGYYGV